MRRSLITSLTSHLATLKCCGLGSFQSIAVPLSPLLSSSGLSQLCECLPFPLFQFTYSLLALDEPLKRAVSNRGREGVGLFLPSPGGVLVMPLATEVPTGSHLAQSLIGPFRAACSTGRGSGSSSSPWLFPSPSTFLLRVPGTKPFKVGCLP